MNGKLCLRWLSRIVVFLCFRFFLLFGQEVQAADVLSYSKNYFVAGDVVIGGAGGLRGTSVNGFATGTININGVPTGADRECSNRSPFLNAQNLLGRSLSSV